MYDRAIESVESLFLRVSTEDLNRMDKRSLKSLARKFRKAKHRLESGDCEKPKEATSRTKNELPAATEKSFSMAKKKKKVRVVFRPETKKKRNRPETAPSTRTKSHDMKKTRLKVKSERTKTSVKIKEKIRELTKSKKEEIAVPRKRVTRKKVAVVTGEVKEKSEKKTTKKKPRLQKKIPAETTNQEIKAMKKTKKSFSDSKTIAWLQDAGIRDEKVYEQFRKRRTSMFTLLRLKRIYFLKDKEGYAVRGTEESQSKKSWVALHEMLLRDFKISKLGDRLRFEVALSRLEDPKEEKKEKKKPTMLRKPQSGEMSKNKSTLHPRETAEEDREKKIAASRLRKKHSKKSQSTQKEEAPKNKAAYEAIRVAKFASKYANKQANNAESSLRRCVERNRENVRVAISIAQMAARESNSLAAEACKRVESALQHKMCEVSDTADRVTMAAAKAAKHVVERT